MRPSSSSAAGREPSLGTRHRTVTAERGQRRLALRPDERPRDPGAARHGRLAGVLQRGDVHRVGVAARGGFGQHGRLTRVEQVGDGGGDPGQGDGGLVAGDAVAPA